MDHFWLRFDPVYLIPLFAISIPIIALIGNGILNMVKSRQREQTRREIAAYVAEGSMTVDDAERLLNAGASKDANAHAAQQFAGSGAGADERDHCGGRRRA